MNGEKADGIPQILIVEDDFLIASELESACIDAGFKVVGVANSCEEALTLASANFVTLAIMDIRLNGNRDGVETAHELFRKWGIRSIFATAHNVGDFRVRAEKAFPLAWVAKPYPMPTLIAVINQSLPKLGMTVESSTTPLPNK